MTDKIFLIEYYNNYHWLQTYTVKANTITDALKSFFTSHPTKRPVNVFEQCPQEKINAHIKAMQVKG